MIRILAPHLTSVRTVAIAVITTVSGFLQAQSLFIEVTNPPMDYALCGPTQPICVTIAHGGPDAILVNGFEGDYAPANWLFDADESGAVLDVTGAPDSISITSGDTTGIGTATYCHAVDLTGTISFDWLFTTLDTNTPFETIGYSINGGPTVLATGGISMNGSVNVAVTAGDIICFFISSDGDSLTSQVVIDNFIFQATTDITDTKAFLTFAAGIDTSNLFTKSTTTVPVSWIPGTDSILIGDLQFGDTVRFSIDVRPSCAADVGASDYSVNIIYQSVLGETEQLIESSFNIGSADLSMNPTTNPPVLPVYFGLIDTIFTQIANLGNGELDTMYYCADANANATLLELVLSTMMGTVSIPAVGVPGNPVSYTCIPISPVEWMILFGVPYMPNNTGLTVGEVWQITDCGAPDDFRRRPQYGCLGSLDCEADAGLQNPIVTTGQNFDILVPDLAATLVSATQPSCYTTENAVITLTITNTGGAPARDIIINYSSPTGYLDFTNYSITDGQGMLTADQVVEILGTPLACAGGAGPSTATDTMFISLLPDSSITIIYETRHDCNCNDVSCASGGSFGPLFGATAVITGVSSACDIPAPPSPSASSITIQAPSVSAGIGGIVEAPLNVAEGEKAVISYTVYAAELGMFNDSFPDAYIESMLSLTMGLDYQAGTFAWKDVNGVTFPATVTYVDGGMANDMLTVRWNYSDIPVGFAVGAGMTFTFCAEPDCSEKNPPPGGCGAPPVFPVTITSVTKATLDPACDCSPSPTLFCPDPINVDVICTPESLGCPGLDDTCDGLIFKEFSMKRMTLGLPDDDNDRFESGVFDFAELKLNRFLQGDSIKALFTATINDLTPANAWTNGYATIKLDHLNYTPLSTVVKIFDVSTAATYTCNAVPVSINPVDSTIVIDFSRNALNGLGCGIPGGYEFDDGDSLSVCLIFQVKEPWAGPLPRLIEYDATMWVSEGPDISAPMFTCVDRRERLTQIPIVESMSTNFAPWGACDLPSWSISESRNYGVPSFDEFPFEVRPLGIPKTVVFNKPAEFAWRLDQFGISLSQPMAPSYTINQINSGIPSQYLIVSGDQVTFLAEQYYTDLGIPDIRPDEGYSFTFSPSVQGSCLSDPGIYDVSYSLSSAVDASVFCTPMLMWQDTQSVNFVGAAQVIVQSDFAEVTVCAMTEDIPLSVTNITSPSAPNTFLAWTSQNPGAISITKLRYAGSNVVITPNAFGIYQLGDLPGGTEVNLIATVRLNSCGPQRLNFLTGWDCESYPTTVLEAVCADPSSVVLKSPPVGYNLNVLAPLTDTILPLCDTLIIMAEIISTDLGYLREPVLQVALPAGLVPIPGSFEFAYPSVTLPDFTGWEPAGMIPVVGGVRTFQLYQLDSTLLTQGLIGSKDLFNDFSVDSNAVSFRFKVATSCTFTAKGAVKFTALGKSPCGNRLKPIPKSSPRISMQKLTPKFKMSFTLPNITLNPCNEEVKTLTVKGTLISGVLSPADSVLLVLPAGLNYVPLSFNSIQNFSLLPPSITTVDQSQTLAFPLAGLAAGTSFIFSVNVMGVDAQQSCTPQEIFVKAVSTVQDTCISSGLICGVKGLVAQKKSVATFKKPVLRFDNIMANLTLDPMTGSATAIFKTRICNYGATYNAGNTITYALYDDVDANGDLTPDDTLVSTLSHVLTQSLSAFQCITVNDTIIYPAGAICTLLGVMNPDLTCTCDQAISAQVKPTINVIFDTALEICSGDMIQIGPLPTVNYDYEWLSVGGSSLALLSATNTTQVTFSQNNATGADIITKYALRTSTGSCFAYDTVCITVHPARMDSIVVSTCLNGDFSLPAPPAGGSNFNWVPSLGLSFPGPDSGFAVVDSVIASQIYNLDYIGADGCSASWIVNLMAVDCGTALTALGDTVWFDFNEDGLQDPFEPGIGGVVVNLYNGSNGALISTTVTDANGYYLFDFLPAGNYFVGFFPADGFVPTSQDSGGDDVNDSDANMLTGLTGNYYLPLDSINLTIDAGFIPDCSLELNLEVEPCIASDSGMIREIKFNITWDGNPYTYDQFVGQDTLLLTFLNQTVELVVDTLFGDTTYTFILGPSFPGPITIEGAVQFALANNCMAGDTQSFDECIFDLALQKVLTSATGMSYGDTLCLDVIVYNQGVQSVSNVTVVDYLPPGYLFLDVESPEWTQAGDYLIALIQTNLDPGESDTLELKLQLLPSLEPNAWLNIAEIASFEDTLGNDQSGNDIDSSPDTDPTNDGGGSVDTDSDNSIDGDGSGNPGDTDPNTDEDDQDPYIPHIFDLALIKELTTPPPYALGQSVVFTITVFNQGTVPAQNIKVSDYIPGGFMFDPANAPNWTLMGSTAMDTLPDVLLPGESETTTINLIIQTAGPDEYVNYAEISYAEDTVGNNTNGTLEDVDSTPDAIQSNDPGGNPNTDSDNTNEGDGLNGGGAPLGTDPLTDEDDQDPAYLILPLIDLTKTTVNIAPAASLVVDNFDVTFHLVIKNTGNTKLTMINLIDNLVSDFQTAFIGITDGPAIIPDSTTTPMVPTINSGYDGSGSDNIFTGLDGCISAGETVGVTVTAEIRQGVELEPFTNNAMTFAQDTLFNIVMDEDTALVVLPTCFMNVVCPLEQQSGTFNCLSDVPPAATTVAQFEAIDGFADVSNECSAISFVAIETNNGGTGCLNSPFIVTRTYILTDTFYVNGQVLLDSIGNPVLRRDTCVVNYTVVDNTVPVIICPGPYFVTCSASEVPVFTTLAEFIAAGGSASDLACGIVTFGLISETSDGNSCPQIVTRTYGITDACGNSATCNQNIFINDEIPPSISCLPLSSAACDINDIPPYLTLSDFLAAGNTVSDNCGIDTASFTLECQLTDGNSCPEIIQRCYSIADLCGNVSIAEQYITLDDEIAPTAVCCPAFDLPLDANGNAVLLPSSLNCGSTDNCTAPTALELSVFPFEFDAEDVGANVVVLTVTDACGNSSTCSVIVNVTGNPVIGIAKRPTNVTNNGDGSYNITYEINVENFGNVGIDSIQVTDDLSATFPTPCTLNVLEITSDDFLVNGAFNGIADQNLLLGSDDIAAGEKGAILLTVLIDNCGNLGPFFNQAIVEGIAPGNMMVADTSTNGSDPDPNGDGVPDETSPTPVTLEQSPYLGVAKYVKSGPTNNGDGTYTITFGVRLENNGNVNLDSLSVTDDLAAVFGNSCGFDVTGLSSEEFQVNLAYDGTADTQLLVPGQEFHSWHSGEICITVVVGPCTTLGAFNNTATADALTPTGEPVSDDSQSGSNPDPDGDGDPTNNDDPTNFELTENPVIGIAKRTVETVLLPDGSANVTFEFNLENFGDVNLNNITLTDNLAAAFPSTCSVSVTNLTSDDFIVNPAYNGTGLNNMLAAGNDLPAGDKGAVLLTINVASCGAAQTSFTNTATTSGTSPSGTLVTDASVNGSDPDGVDNDNNPDEMSGTPVSFVQNPVIGVAKRNVQTELLADGSANVTFEFNLENFGNVNLDDLALIDSLGVAFPSTCEVTVMALTSDDFIVDPAYDGIANVNMLAAGNDLPVGDKGAVLLTINVANCGSSQTLFNNSATASGTSPGGTTVTDNSVNGSDPDGVDNDNNPDEESGTPVSFTQNPVIGVAKRNVQTELLADGSANVTFEFNLENFGNVNLNDLTLIDSLGITFPSTCEVSVMTLTSDDFIVDPSYDGITNVNMLAAGNDLPVGDKGAVLLTVNVANCGSAQTAFINTAEASGTSPGGTTVTDNSVNGADPDGTDNDNNPDEESGTPVSFTQNPVIGVAKRNVQTELLADGSANVTFEFNLENFGNVNLNDLTVIDSLGVTFPSTCEVSVVTLTSDDFIVDPSYDGITNVNMLAAGNDLPVGDKGAVLLTVNVANCGSAQTAFINTAEASGTSPGGTTVTDNSVDGADPDGTDNDNNPDEESGTPVSFTQNPVIGVAKRNVQTELLADGSANVTFEFNLENFGNVNLNDLTLIDSLGVTFPSTCEVSVMTLTSDDFIVDPSYDGITSVNILAAGNDLPVGDKGAVLLTVNVANCGSAQTAFINTADASGTSPGGTTVTDTSVDGADPDGTDNDNNPDEESGTPVSFIQNPVIGVAKRNVQTELLADGSANVTFEFNLENFGNVNLNDLTLIDSLGVTFPSTCEVTVTALTSDDFIVDPTFDGLTSVNMLAAGNDLPVGDKGAVLLTVNVANCGSAQTAFINTADASGTSPGGTTVTDTSVDGADPDGTDNDNNPDEESGTPVSFVQNPVIGVAKRNVKTELLADGSANVTFEFNLENFGNVNLNDLTLIDSLGVTFPSTCEVTVMALTSDDFIVDPAFDGLTSVNMLAAGNDLPVGDKGAVLLTVNVANCGSAQTAFINTAEASGTSPGGTTVTDASVNGADPDGVDNDNNPDEESGTPVSFTQNPVIGVAKRNVKTELLADGSANVTFEFNLENFGNVNLNDLTLIDSLGVTFPSTCEVSVMTLTSDDFIVDPSYDGITNVNMLAAGNDLPVGDKGAVLLTVNVANCGSAQTAFINTAEASGTSPGGTTVTDASVNGADPDGVDNDNNPDEESGTPVSFTQNPVIGVAKRNVKTELLADGSANVTFEFNLENFGNVNLNDLTLIDSLGVTFPSTCEVSVMTLTSDDFIVDPSYDGITNVNMLAAGNDLPVGDKGAVLLTVNVANCGSAQTAFINTAEASGTSPGGTTVTDNSVDGADPDGTDNDNNPDEESGTPVSFVQNPVIGVAKRNVQTTLMADGSTSVTFEFNLENFGNVNLNSLTLIDDLSATFPTTCVVTVESLTSDDFIVDPAFNGVGLNNMLAAGNDLPVGDKGAVLLTVNVADCSSSQTFFINTATASGTSPGGTTVTDNSVNGSDPDGVDNDNNPDEESGTPVLFAPQPIFGVAKRAVSVVLNSDGTTDVTYEINIENFGNVNLDSLQVTDDLAAAFPATCAVTVTSLTSDDFVVNAGFDGVADINLLALGNDLPVGDKGSVLFTINVDSCGSNMGPFGNIAIGSAISPGDSTLTDTSADGADPDPNGDGDPSEMDTTFVSFSSSGILGVAKRLVSIDYLSDGSADMIFEFNVENFGDVDLDSLQVVDSLINTFGAPCAISVLSLTSDDFIVNPSYNGITDFDLLNGAEVIHVGDKGAILLEINVVSCEDNPLYPGPFNNSAFASGITPSGEEIIDESVDGADPDPDGNGNPDEMGATPINFIQVLNIGLAKNVVSAVINNDGTFSITYEFNIENFSTVVIDSIQVVDDLGAAFPGPCSVAVTELTSDDFLVNPAYDGVTDINLLLGSDDLVVDDKGAILLSILVSDCGILGPFENNATLTGEGPGGVPLVDESVDGTDPDPNGDGVPDEQSPTIVDFTENPLIGVSKRVSGGPALDDDNNYVITYELHVQNYGDVDLDSIQVVDSLAVVFANAESWTLVSLESEEFNVNVMFNGGTDPNLLIGNDKLLVGNEGAIYVTLRIAPGGFDGPYNNFAVGTGESPFGTVVIDTSQNGSDPDPDSDGDPTNNDEVTPVVLACFVGIICPNVPDTLYSPNDVGWCRAVFNLPPAEIITCAGAPDSLIQYMLTGQGAFGIPNDVWITGQPTGLEYIVGTTKVSMRASIPSLPDIGFSDTCMFWIVVIDKEYPVAVCQDIFVMVDGDCMYTITPDDVDGGSTDNCAIDTLLISRDGGQTFVNEITFTVADLQNPFVQVILQVTDTSGNVSICVATVTVLDVEPPSVICQDDITVQTEPNFCYGKIPVIIPPILANDNCLPLVTFDQYPDAGVLFGSSHQDSIEVYLIVTDMDGNMDTCSLFVHLDDAEAPEWLNCPRPPIQTKAMPGMCGAFVNFSLPIALDNCELDTIEQVDMTGLTSGDMFPVGTTILKYLAYDVAGNVSDTCRIKILVNDAQIPVITCLEDLTVFNDAGECGAVVNNLAIEATDNCPDNIAITYEITDENGDVVTCGITDASGELFPVGINTVTYKVYDQSIVLITEVVQGLVDAIEITNFGPSSMDLSCVTIQRVGAGLETYVIPDGTIIPPGGTYVHTFITNIATGTPAGYILVLEDTQYDHVSTNGYNIGAGFTGVLSSGDVWRQYICDHDNAGDWVVADACHPSTLGAINEGLVFFPDNGTISSLQNQLPNEVTCQFTVTVTDIELPYCAENLENNYQPDDLPVAIDLLNDGCASSIINVTDVFEVGHVNVIDLQITYPNVGALTVTITSPSGTEVTLFEGLCPGLQDVDISLSDTADVSVNLAPCGPLGQGGFYIPQDALSIFCEEPVQGAWTLEVSSSSGAVGTIDNWELQIFEQVPYSQQDTIIENVLGECGAPFTWTHPIVGDNCCDGEITVDYETEDGIDVPQAGPIEGGETVTEFFEVGITTIIYTLTDGSGNVSQCQFNVTVLDTEAPIVACPQNITINLDPGACNVPVNFVPSFISDNCSIDSIYSNSGEFFDIGTHEGTIIVYDPAGNADTCTFTINVLEYLPGNTELACNNQIQLSLPEDCTVQVGADMILEGDDYRCYENYCITIEDEDGNVVPGGILTLDHVGTCVTVTVTDCLGGGNSCWGKICVELKLKPQISCPPDITVGCNQTTNVDITGEPEVESCEQTITKTYTDDFTDNGECGEPRIFIERTWKVTDESGNFSTCVQNITVESFRFDQVEFPAHVIAYSCVDVFNNPALLTPAFSGEPTINGQSIYGDHYCEIFVGYWDEKLYDANCEGSYSILRHWLIQDECLPLEEGVNPLRHIQNIQVKDNVDPVITCPQDITVSTGNNCVAGISLPVPHYADICSDIATFTVQTSSGSLLHYGGNNYVLANLAIGTHTVTYKISDNCKNTVTCQFQITVVDDVIPVAICDEHTIVTLTNDGPNGVTLVPASVFDDGSWDNCGPVTFRVRRMDSCIDFDWTTEGACIDDNPGGIPPVNSRDRGTVQRECAVFACCDVGNGPVMVELEVTDIHGNVNTCMVEVEVQDKLSPFVECPPDIIVSCDFWFNVQEGTFVDAEGNGNGNLDEDPLTPIFGNMYDAFSYNDDESVRNNIIINDPGNEQYNQPHFWGIDGWADDNCEVSLQVRVRVIDDCSGNDLPANAPPGAVKLIERRFSALDGNDGVAPGTCTQRIWVVNYDPFYITDNTCNNSNTQDGVIWPCDVLITTCPEDPMGTGQPTIFSDGCSLIGVTFEDTRFDFVDGACFKILREWKIIDWCQYVPQTGAGQWSYVQVIKVHDEDGPAFQDCPTAPVELCVADQGIRLPDNNQAFLGEDDPNASSCSVHVTLEHTIKETCSDVVFYDVKVYPFNGTDFIQLKPRTAATIDTAHLATLNFDTELATLFSIRQNGLPYNDPLDCSDYHKVLWSVEDGCGNWSHCEYLFRLEDCKQPTPVCINGLSTVVMPIGGEVTVWAKDFNASSFDDCTPAENLLYSFSGDTYEPSYTYTCDNVPAFGAQLSVDIWVADAGVDHNCNGQIEWSERNKDHCTTTIVITDNAGVCPGSGSILAGEILTPRTDAVELVNVFLSHPDYVFPSYVTVKDGRFRFGSVPYNQSYTITPARNDNHKNGVSTLDLVRIQKHLLGIEAFTSPYQFIAADANYNQQVSAIDMIEIRKLILGIYPTFPQNQSWRFVDVGTGISIENPWQYNEVIQIADLSSDSMMYNDFVAVKVGDVNNTAKANALQVQPRDGQRIVFVNVTEAEIEGAGDLVKINFTIDEQLEGFQWTLESSGLEYMGMESSTISMDDSHIGLLQDGVMTMSWNAVPGNETSGAHQQDQTFSMLFRKMSGGNLKDMIRMTSRVTESEGYTLAGETVQPQLHFGSANSPLEFALYQNEPNPWNGTTLVRFDLPEEGDVKFTVFDASGKVVVLKEAFYKPGPHSVLINNKDINTNGVFYYRVDCGQYSATKKMVRIN